MTDSSSILLPSLLLPPSLIVAKTLTCSSMIIDAHETYPKQTLRNRYFIGGPNDIRPLVVPVHKPRGHETKTCDVEIDYSENWPAHHRKTLITAYSKSPYFLYYSDFVFEEFNSRHRLLIDLNSALQAHYMNWLSSSVPAKFSQEYVREFEGFDMRNRCKHSSDWELRNTYYQPFDNIHGFRPSLSVLDIIFNLGPEAAVHLLNESKYASLPNS